VNENSIERESRFVEKQRKGFKGKVNKKTDIQSPSAQKNVGGYQRVTASRSMPAG